MPEPPDNLVQLLGRLRLASDAQMAAVAPLAKRLAGELPDFESVWVDALAQRRVLTPWQAAEINAGRAEGLVHGNYQLLRPVASPPYAQAFQAIEIDSQREVRLLVARATQRPLDETLRCLEKLSRELAAHAEHCEPIESFGTTAGVLWLVTPPVAGKPLRDWMLEHGRVPAQAVLQLARAMALRLAELETAGIVHGGFNLSELAIDPTGQLSLPSPGLRGVLRPREGYSFSELSPEAYDYLAPERIADGTLPDIASDIYACGALWWHLLAGRPPFAGGNALAKLKAVHAARVVDVRPFNPLVSDSLAGLISDCLHRDAAHRPRSFAELSDRLGAPTPAGQSLVATLIRGGAGAWHGVQRSQSARPRRVPQGRPRVSRAATALGSSLASGLLVAGLGYWMSGAHSPTLPAIASTGATPAASTLTAASQEPSAPDTQASGEVAKSIPSSTAADYSPPAVAFQAPAQPISAPAKPRRDPQVRPASANGVGPRDYEPVIEDVVLPGGETLRVEQLDLVPHVRVRGRAGSRPRIVVPSRGLVVGCEDVSFEGVDFVWERVSSEPDRSRESQAAMLNLRSRTVTFRGCSFSSRSDDAPVAIRCDGLGEALPGLGTEVTLNDCVFDGLAAVVEQRSAGAIQIVLNNCLCVAAGPILRLSRPPQADEPVRLILNRITTRGDSAVVHCRYTNLTGTVGAIQIDSSGSAFASGARSPLVVLSGRTSPEPLVAALNWSGQGSIVTPQTPLAVWQPESRPGSGLPDDELTIAGLVRGTLEFAGRPDGPPDASRVVRWQVPLRSPDAPGADPSRLASPRATLTTAER